jgi:hypothetical protein
LASRSTMRSWLPAYRLGEDVVRLQDGSLRAVLECGASLATHATLLGVLRTLLYPTQIVVQARRPAVGDETPILTRLRASHASLMSRLSGRDSTFVRRLLVVVSCVTGEDGEAGSLLRTRTDDLQQRLDRQDLASVRLSGRELDAVAVHDGVQEGRCEVRLGGCLARTLIITRLLERLCVDSLDAVECEHQLSFHIQPMSRPDHTEVSAYVTLWAETRDALDVATERAEALLVAQGVRARRPYLQAEPALVSGLPLCLDQVAARRVLTAAQLRPSDSPPAGRGGEPLLYGIDPGTSQPLLLDRFALSNPNAVVFGEARARSRLLNLELTRARLAGRHVHLIGQNGAYGKALAALGGRLVAPSAFDPFSVPDQGGGLESRIQALLAVIELIAGGLPPAASAAVEDAIAFTYAAHGYSYESNDSGLSPPVLDEICSALLRRGESSQAELDALGSRLEQYTAGAGRRLFDRRPSPPQLGPLSVHDLTGLPPEDQPAGALLSLDRVWRSMSREHSSLVVLDEADQVLTGKAGLFVSRLMATAAEGGLGLTLATGEVAAALSAPVRDAVLGAGLTVLLRQTPAVLEPLAEAYRLTPAEQSWLLRAPADEGLLIAQDRRLAFRAIASDEEEQLITGGTG